jgi:hypothetical protein
VSVNPGSNGDGDEDFPPDPLSDDEPREERAGFVPEFVRRVAVAGLGALFMTEEGIRTLAGQLKLPKEVLGYVLSQAERTKDEVGRVVGEEVRRFFQSELLRQEFLKLISGMSLEIKAQVRLIPRDKGEGESSQVVIQEVTAKRGRRKKE